MRFEKPFYHETGVSLPKAERVTQGRYTLSGTSINPKVAGALTMAIEEMLDVAITQLLPRLLKKKKREQHAK